MISKSTQAGQWRQYIFILIKKICIDARCINTDELLCYATKLDSCNLLPRLTYIILSEACKSAYVKIKWHHILFFPLCLHLHLEQTHENLQKFEYQAGLTDVRYSPHKGLCAEDTRFHRLGDGTMPVSTNNCLEEARQKCLYVECSHFCLGRLCDSFIFPLDAETLNRGLMQYIYSAFKHTFLKLVPLLREACTVFAALLICSYNCLRRARIWQW